MSQDLTSAAVVIGALRVNSWHAEPGFIVFLFKNSVDPDQMASYQDPQCFPLCLLIHAYSLNYRRLTRLNKMGRSVVHKIISMTRVYITKYWTIDIHRETIFVIMAIVCFQC